MLPQLAKNKYLNALFFVMLVSAGTHLVLLFFQFLATGNWYLINYFNIVGVTIWLPTELNNFWGNVASFIVGALFYLIVLVLNH